MATVGSVIVDLEARTAKFNSQMAKASKKLRDFGRAATRHLTLPLLVAGGAAIKFATEFDAEMTKVNTLVGVAEKQVQAWRKSILAMAPAVGKGPGELARALFVVTSAGERGADALMIVEQAAKAAAIGLGDAAVTARSVTAAMQAYSEQGLTATRATEILVATVREGNLVAEDLAGSLGRVIGIASQVGVTFEQVGGFMATFSRLGVSAQESATALRQILVTIIKPTKMSEQALKGVGLSAALLRDELGEQGLSGMLALLMERFRGNEEMLAQVIPNVRALSGVMGTAGAQAERFAEINKNVANSLGILDEGFKRVQETAKFQLDQFVASSQVLLVTIGAKMIPAFQKLLDIVGALVKAFTALNPEIQKTTIVVLALAAAVGPLALILGKLAAIAGVVVGVITAIAVSAAAPVAAVSALIVLLGTLAAGMLTLNKRFDLTEQEIRHFTNATIEARTKGLQPLFDRINEFKKFPELFAKIKEHAVALRNQGVAFGAAWTTAIREATVWAGRYETALKNSVAPLESITGDVLPEYVDAYANVNQFTDLAIRNLAVLIEHAKEFKDELPKAVKVPLSSVNKLQRAIEGMSVAVAASIMRTGLAFQNLAKTIIDSLKQIMISNWTRKFMLWMAGMATGGGIFGGIATVLGFQSGGSGASRVGASSEDVVPAFIKPNERVVREGQPSGGGGMGAVVHLTLQSFIPPTRGDMEMVVDTLREYGVVVNG